MKQHNKNNRSGFTLIEVLIAIVIISLTALSFMWLQQQTWKNTSASNKMLLAGQAIEAKIESIRVQIAVDTSVFRTMTNSTQTTVNGITVTSTLCAPGDSMPNRNNNVRKVTIQASWKVWNPETLTVATFISRDF